MVKFKVHVFTPYEEFNRTYFARTEKRAKDILLGRILYGTMMGISGQARKLLKKFFATIRKNIHFCSETRKMLLSI